MQWRRLSNETQKQMKDAQLFRCRNPDLADVVERNIGTIVNLQRQFERGKSLQDHIADAITAFAGSMVFVYLHVVWFLLWIVLNYPAQKSFVHTTPFDPYPFGLLTMIVSLEAIFLSTFVLVSQNRMGLVADHRANLDLQINLLAEHEITRLLVLVDAIADRLGIEAGKDPEMDELKKDIAPDVLLREIEAREREGHQYPEG